MPHCRLYAAEILDDSSSDDGAGRPPDKRAPATRASSVSGDSESESEQEELDDDQLLKRRQMLRERALARTKREEVTLFLDICVFVFYENILRVSTRFIICNP